MVTVPLLLGAGLGLGVWLCLRALRPRPEPIDDILARLDRPGRPVATPRGPDGSGRPGERVSPSGLGAKVARSALNLVATLGVPTRPTPAFELAGRSVERHALEKVVVAPIGVVTPTLVAGLLVSSGLNVPVALVVLASLGCGLAGWFVPELSLRELAEQRRRAFRHALSAYLDLVNILLAGGAGIETALHAAADAGDGWAFERIRQALNRARLTGQTPWDTFADLGAGLGVEELTELAASVSLAGSHGARIRSSLAAKADAVRGHQVAEAESSAEAATERMTIPVTVMLAGFLVFIAYPALLEVTSVT